MVVARATGASCALGTTSDCLSSLLNYSIASPMRSRPSMFFRRLHHPIRRVLYLHSAIYLAFKLNFNLADSIIYDLVYREVIFFFRHVGSLANENEAGFSTGTRRFISIKSNFQLLFICLCVIIMRQYSYTRVSISSVIPSTPP